jgi:3'-5' exoribonuclease
MIKDLEKNCIEKNYFILKEIVEKTTKNGDSYLDLTLSDKSGNLSAKMWSTNAKKLESDSIKEGNLVYVVGKTGEYKEKIQLTIENIRAVNSEDKVDIKDYAKAVPVETNKLFSIIGKFTKDIKNKDLQKMIITIIAEYKDELYYYPAAKMNHHAMYGGLLYHMERMLMLAKTVSSQYPSINKDLLYAGVILHDIEKINEMDASEIGVVKDFTKKGQLLGHIVMGVEKIGEIGRKLMVDEEIIVNLQHLIASHHGKKEWGAAVEPKTVEAIALHYIDNLDSTLSTFEEACEDLEKGEFGEKNYPLKVHPYKADIKEL